jgi:leishmanolysin
MRVPLAKVCLLIILLSVNATSIFKSATRSLQSTGTMRIWVDYDDSDKEWLTNGLRIKYIFSKKIMERTKVYYSTVLIVKSPKAQYTWPDTQVSDTKTVKGRTVAYDLWTYFSCYNKDDDIFASAEPFAYDSDTGRAIVGYVEVNLNAISVSTAELINSMSIFVHEFYHILVFNSDLFPKFIDASGNPVGVSNLVGNFGTTIKGTTRQAYKGANVLAFARTFLNYPSLTGVVLENDGGDGSAGSHWEHMYWSTDFMSPTATVPCALSELSLSMALDSGWFTINKDYIQPLEYGKNAGADIQTNTCPTSSIAGFCDTADEKSCSPDWMYKTTCYNDTTFSETCKFKYSDVACSVPDGEYGANVDPSIDNLGDTSRCLVTTMGGIAKPRCAKATCTGSTSITYTFAGGKTCTCSANSAAAACSDGTLSATCPGSISGFCTRMDSTNKCPGDCSGKGLCLGTNGSKRCFCVYGWKGVDCSTANDDETDVKLGLKTSNRSKIIWLGTIVISLIAAIFF